MGPLHQSLSTLSQSSTQAPQTTHFRPPNTPLTSINMSNVGSRSTYEAGDQRTVSDAEIKAQQEANRFHEGKENSHKANDSKDERSIANQLERETKREKEPSPEPKEVTDSKKDSTLPAKNHGNEPSKGAKIDQELKEEEEAELKKKGAFGPQ